MNEIVKLSQVEEKLISVRGHPALLDFDVAALYGVETKHVNQAVRNNPDKFPKGYIIELGHDERRKLVKNFDRFGIRHSSATTKAFTERGLYMLSTILKSPQATQTAIAIIETFTKIRELSRALVELSQTKEKSKQQSLMEKSGEMMTDILGEGMKTTDTETSFEINFAVMKLKHTVKRKPENENGVF
ncbi:ORF6N domain-containing protein [Opitutaceae bacterium TAV4]|nr:ORF6N domain-containing protein [Opitutaceae bacterium TAV4]RRJ99223.1 ORF6N domain-containing protein [Opitutaceae bacterium TAV3]